MFKKWHSLSVEINKKEQENYMFCSVSSFRVRLFQQYVLIRFLV